jgi:hypothetical protein
VVSSTGSMPRVAPVWRRGQSHSSESLCRPSQIRMRGCQG